MNNNFLDNKINIINFKRLNLSTYNLLINDYNIKIEYKIK